MSAWLPPVSFCHFSAFWRLDSISLLTLSLLPLSPLHCLPSIEVWITFKTTCSSLRATEPGSRQAGNGVTAELQHMGRDRHELLPDDIARICGWRRLDLRLRNIFSGIQVCPVQDGWQHPGVNLTEEADRKESDILHIPDYSSDKFKEQHWLMFVFTFFLRGEPVWLLIVSRDRSRISLCGPVCKTG